MEAVSTVSAFVGIEAALDAAEVPCGSTTISGKVIPTGTSDVSIVV